MSTYMIACSCACVLRCCFVDFLVCRCVGFLVYWMVCVFVCGRACCQLVCLIV